MHLTVDDLIAHARQLSSDEFELLMVRLNLEVALPLDPEIEDAWMAEVERRVDAVDRGEMQAVPWDEARKRLGL